MRKVLDAWAVLAWINGEVPAVQALQKLLDDAEGGQVELGMCMVNAGEVFYRLAKTRGLDFARSFWDDFQTTSVQFLDAPNWLIFEAANWKSKYAISYADAFAIATAVRQDAPLVSGDPDFQVFRSNGAVKIEWIGRE